MIKGRTEDNFSNLRASDAERNKHVRGGRTKIHSGEFTIPISHDKTETLRDALRPSRTFNRSARILEVAGKEVGACQHLASGSRRTRRSSETTVTNWTLISSLSTRTLRSHVALFSHWPGLNSWFTSYASFSLGSIKSRRTLFSNWSSRPLSSRLTFITFETGYAVYILSRWSHGTHRSFITNRTHISRITTKTG